MTNHSSPRWILSLRRWFICLFSVDSHCRCFHHQAQELRVYFKSLGAEISEEKSPKGIEDDLHKIIGVCEACFKEGNESEIETVLNDIVSIMILVSLMLGYFDLYLWESTACNLFNPLPCSWYQIPTERAENLILAFCEKLVKAPGYKLGLVCLKA